MSSPKTESKTKVSNPIMVLMKSPEISDERRGQLELKCDIARFWVMSKSPFYGQLMMGLQDKISYVVPTAATNGEIIIWNPDFLEKMINQEVRFVLIHETLHCAYGHIWRFPPLIDKDGNKKKDEKGNIACDHAINLRILASNIDVKMPKGGLADDKFKELAEEEIYNLLPDSQDNSYGLEGDPTGEFIETEDDGDGKNKSKNDDNKKGEGKKGIINLRNEWERRLIACAQAAKASGQGNLPADLQRILDDRMAVRIDWKQELCEFVHNNISLRNDFTRSPQRHAWMSVIMPRKKRDAISTIVFVRDSSGSISDEIVAQFNSLIYQCMAEVGCSAIIIDCDACIQEIYYLSNGDQVPNRCKGGGGTSFVEPFVKTMKLKEDENNIAGLVYLTDLAGDHINPHPNDLPVLWLCTVKDQVAPFGRTLFVEV